jgi:hypothetical protein
MYRPRSTYRSAVPTLTSLSGTSRRLCLLGLLVACAVLSAAQPARAATASVPRSPTGSYLCPGGVEVVLSTGGSTWTPLRVSGTRDTFVPEAFRYELLDTEGTVSTSAELTKRSGSIGAVTCTYETAQLGDGGGQIGLFRWSVRGIFRS